ncbi:MAG: CRISPR-associated endonuclease Cas2 [Caldilineaceae bacterium]
MASQNLVGRAPRNRRQWVVVSYDIPDDKRRTKVMKTLAGYGQRAQYSVFECELRPTDLTKLKTRLRDIIDQNQDDVRFYPLCDNCLGKVTLLGKAELHRRQDYVVI